MSKAKIEWEDRISRYELYDKLAQLGHLKANSVLQDEPFRVYIETHSRLGYVQGHWYECRSKGHGKHRLLADCHVCGRLVPFGRMHQHTPACRRANPMIITN